MNLEDALLRSTRALQPSAVDAGSGALYCVTDEDNIVEQSNGAAWVRYSPTSGAAGISSLTGDVTGTGPGATATTIAANAVSNTKLRDSGALSVIGRSANSTGDPADISASAASAAVLRESGSVLGFGTVATAGIADDAVTDAKIRESAALTVIGRSANSTGNPADIAASAASGAVLRESGSVLGFGTVATAGIADAAVTYAKIQDVSAISKLLGRGSGAGAGDVEEITLGTGLSMSGTTVSASAGAAGRMMIFFGQPNSGSGHSPGDSLQYFFLQASAVAPGTASNGPFGPMMTRDGTATRVYGKIVIGGTLGSNQNVTFTLHNNTQATSEVITAVGQLTANPSLISNTGMTLAYTAGDVMQISMTTPVWSPNPTGVFYSFAVEFTPT